MEKIKSLSHLYAYVPENERIMLDVLREITIAALPSYTNEKISYNVPFFYGNKGISIVWPGSVPRGGFKNGVLYGFWYGKFLKDIDNYLSHGTNKQIFYKIYRDVDEIDEKAIIKLLKEAALLDQNWKRHSLSPIDLGIPPKGKTLRSRSE